MRAILYLRVSTDEQASHGHSLAAQEQAMRAYCAAFGYEVAEVVRDEGQSAKSMRRPGLQAVLKSLHDRQADGIVVYKLDRLTRSVRDLYEMVDRSQAEGWALCSVTEKLDTGSASGRLFVGLLGLMSQWERETISERTRVGLAQARRDGKILGRPSKARRRAEADKP